MGIGAIFFSESVAMYGDNHSENAGRKPLAIVFKDTASKKVEFYCCLPDDRENPGLEFYVPFSLFKLAENANDFFVKFPCFIVVHEEAEKYLLEHPDATSAPVAIKEANRLSAQLLEQLGIK